MAIPGIAEVWEGGSSTYTSIESIWEGTASGYNLLWEKNPWYFTDDFERTTLGSDWVVTGGSQISAGQLRKNNSNGSADNWTAQSFPTDDLYVEVTLGTINGTSQRSSIALGSPDRYVFAEFSVNGGIIGDYDGTYWSTRANIPSLSLAQGDTIVLRRWGTSITFLHNGTIRATATSSQAQGAAYRRVNLSVRRETNYYSTYYSPAFDDVKIGPHKL